jgi:predicted helicase
MSSNEAKPFQTYLQALQKKLILGDATELTHRSALEALVESLEAGITATNEPKHIECGAPDFIVRRGAAITGYIEAKDIGKSLDEAEKSEQLTRYRASLSNLVLTDYLEFRWYVDGERRLPAAHLGTLTQEGKIRQDKAGAKAVVELMRGFLAHKAEGVGSPKDLAVRMARQARMIRDLIRRAFVGEPETGSLHSQLVAFRGNLISDLSVEQFADMYAQTIAYGLFAARCAVLDGKDFTRQNAAYLLPKTNPFLRSFFSIVAGPSLDDRIAWLVDDLAQVLAQAEMGAVLKDFGKHSGKEDPVVHFYETFLKEYDAEIREMRGVYYTPEPVVPYIVRSIDRLLKGRFNRPQGLADEKALILDPAVGTATFLYMAVNEIHQATVGKGQQGSWNAYVAEKLLPRIFGFELQMAPYAVAHLKLGLLLQETGYEFQSEQRLGIYLTDTLDEAIKHADTLFAGWITAEANAAAGIKRDEPIMVVLGNPPYFGKSANKGKWARRLVERYKTVDGKPLGEKNPKWLQDDYVKFLGFAQWRIERTGQGVLGFITNHGYLDNPTFRGMRQSLMDTFTDIYVLNLHGNKKKKEVAPDDAHDENVFDIQQGVAISILVKEPGKTGPAAVHHADLWGLRKDKYQVLLESDICETNWVPLAPTSPFYLFVPVNAHLLSEYEKGWKITDVLPISNVGLVTSRDHFVMDFDNARLVERMTDFRGTISSDGEIRDRFGLNDRQGWRVADARKAVRQDKDWERAFTNCMYRPFDVRSIFYHEAVIERTRIDIMRHMLPGGNLGLISARSNKSSVMDHFFCSRVIMETKCGESTTQSCLFPLYLHSAEGEMQLDGGGRRPNLNPGFIKTVSERLGLTLVEDGSGDLEGTFGPEDIFNYAYAVFHSPTYRTRYAAFLKIDFPHLPLTSNRELFGSLVGKGAELVAFHLMESPALDGPSTEFPVSGLYTVEKVSYDRPGRQHFGGVPPEVWDFHIGGYQVAQKWLKDRRGRTLTHSELTRYQKVALALKETIRLMGEIDSLIPEWPSE